MAHGLLSPLVCTPSCCLVWGMIHSYAPLIFANINWSIGNGASIDVIHDPWLSSTPLARWPAPLETNLLQGLMIKDLLILEERKWNQPLVSQLFQES